MNDNECQCGYSCGMEVTGTTTGGCWTGCGQDAECNGVCIRDHCLPSGSVSGTFTDIPIYSQGEERRSGGVADVTLRLDTIGDVTFTEGFGRSKEQGTTIYLFAVVGDKLDPSRFLQLVFSSDAYRSGTVDLFDADRLVNVFLVSQTFDTAGSLGDQQGNVVHGTVTISTPDPLPISQGRPVSGEIAEGGVVGVMVESSGSHTRPCG